MQRWGPQAYEYNFHAGNYRLGYQIGDTFIVKYVGRSDVGLGREVDAALARFPYLSAVQVEPAFTVEQAYERECLDYHRFGGSSQLVNQIHPRRPVDRPYLRCPNWYCNS
jgi:hypothetical protein